MGRQRTSLWSWAVGRAFLAVLIALVVSGAPRALASAIHGDEPPCAADCDDEDEDGRCAPICATGPCAKVFPSVPALRASIVDAVILRHDDTAAVIDRVTREAPDGHLERVFHPPRA